MTNAPGLVGALLVGVSFAKSLAWARGIPVLGVHHMEGHLFAPSLEHPEAVPPFTALLVSGGHTLLVDVAAWGEYEVLGATRDDAAGEAFDKVAKLLGLPYPGGRHIERLAAHGDPSRHRFTRPMLRRDQRPATPTTSTSRSAASRRRCCTRCAHPAWTKAEHRHIARGFQDALIETLVEKTARAAALRRRRRVVLGGGVACNGALVAAMRQRLATGRRHRLRPEPAAGHRQRGDDRPRGYIPAAAG